MVVRLLDGLRGHLLVVERQGRPDWSRLGFLGLAPALRDADLGSSEADGNDRILIDRVSRLAYVVNRTLADRILKAQWPPAEAIVLTPEELDELVDLMRRTTEARPRPSPQAIIESMRRHSAAVAGMVRWLDAWLEGQSNEQQGTANADP